MSTSGDSIHVLHVDDEPNFADMAAQFLESHNNQIEVRTATDLEAGLALLSDNDIDCIVSDYDMPRKNGIEFLETVREEYPDLPFILYTGKGSEEVASEAVSAGVSDYLQKETGTDHYTVLANRITNLVTQYRAESEVQRYTQQKEKTERYRERMLDVLSETETTTDEKIQEVLALGCERLDVETGFLVMIDEERDRHEVINVSGSDLVQKGVSDLSKTYCRKTIQSDTFLTISNAIEEGWEDDPAYEAAGLGCYLGGKLSTEDALFGTLCFVDRDPRDQFTQHELAFFDVLVRWFTQILERRRRQNEADTIFENVQDGIFLIDVLGEGTFEIRRVNQAYETLTGLSKDDITGKSPDEILTADEAARVEDQFNKCVQQRAPIEYDEKLTFSGETKFWQTQLAPIIEEGEVTQIVGATRDYTQQKKREQRYNAIFNQTYQFTGLLKPDGTVIEANESALAFGGLERDEILGKKLWEVAWFDYSEETRERGRQAVEKAAGGEFVRHELQVQGDDRDAVIDFSVRPVTNEDDEVILLVPEGRDITERKEREQRLEGQREQLEVINRVLRHDIRNDMTVVLGEAENLIDKKQCEPHARRIKQKGEDIVELSEKARQLKGLIGSDSFEKNAINVAELVKQTVADLEQTYPDAVFKVDLPTRADATVSYLIDSAIRNVVENAVEHNDQSIPKVEVTVTKTEDETEDLKIEVADNGPGIPDIEREIIETGTETTLKHSNGLGLWLASWTVSQSGGRITFSENSPRGTILTIRLPSSGAGTDSV